LFLFSSEADNTKADSTIIYCHFSNR